MESKDNDILARLESEFDTEVAEIDYYASMAFDERLLAQLELEAPITTITTERISTEVPSSPLFKPNGTKAVQLIVQDPDNPDNEMIEEVALPVFAFKLEGTATFDPTSLQLSATVSPEGEAEATIQIQNDPQNPDKFILHKVENEELYTETHSIKSVLLLFGSLADINPVTFQSVLAKTTSDTPEDNNTYRKTLKLLWDALGESGGSKETTRTLIHKIPGVNTGGKQEFLKLKHTEKEESDRSTILLTLEHSAQYVDLDVEDSHVLELVYTIDAMGDLAQDATRIILSGLMSPELTIGRSAKRISQGRKTELDLSDPKVIELFVDWFDQLVAA